MAAPLPVVGAAAELPPAPWLAAVPAPDDCDAPADMLPDAPPVMAAPEAEPVADDEAAEVETASNRSVEAYVWQLDDLGTRGS